MNPTCCVESQEARTARVFVPVVGQERAPHWVVPCRDERGEIVKGLEVPCRYCPFCGVALGVAQLAFESPVALPRVAGPGET